MTTVPWGYPDQWSEQDFAEARRIYDVMVKHGDPISEKGLKALANTTSIGAAFKYLNERWGVCRVAHWTHGTEADRYTYLLPSHLEDPSKSLAGGR